MTNEEFEQLIDKKKEKLYRFAFSILKNNEDAKDAVQETVLKLWIKRKKLNKRNNIDSLLMFTIRNLCFDVHRKNNQQKVYEKNITHNMSTTFNYENTDLLEKVLIELKNLPTLQRIAIELKDIQGYKYNEISKILDLSINSIRVNVSRGRKKLYETFKEEIKND